MKKFKMLFMLLFVLGLALPIKSYAYEESYTIYALFRGEEAGTATGDFDKASLSTTSLNIIEYDDNAKENFDITVSDITFDLQKTTEIEKEISGNLYVKVYLKEPNIVRIQLDTVVKNKKTKGTISFYIGEKEFKVSYKYTPVYMTKTSYLCAPGEKATMKVKNSTGKIKWKSSNKKVATVNSKGVVKAKKAGWTLITATMNGHKVGTIVNVTKNKNMKAMLKRGYYIWTKWTYSMEKRTTKGYYDCSSLVWQIYKQYENITFGTSSAGTTATEYPWCVSNCKKVGTLKHKSIYKGNSITIPGYMQPGDIGFCSESKSTSKITHVQTFYGYSFGGFDKKGKVVLGAEWIFPDWGEYPAYMWVFRPTSKK